MRFPDASTPPGSCAASGPRRATGPGAATGPARRGGSGVARQAARVGLLALLAATFAATLAPTLDLIAAADLNRAATAAPIGGSASDASIEMPAIEMPSIAPHADAPSGLAAAPHEPPSADDPPLNPATRVRREVEARLALFEREIGRLEADRDRTRLLARKFTVDTFLAVATLPRSLAFGPAPDPLPLWRYDFRGAARALAPLGTAPQHDLDGARDGERSVPALATDPPAPWDRWRCGGGEALQLRFTLRLLTLLDGDDPPTIGGLVLIEPQRTLLLATWCEPCLAPIAIDFPVVPEAFLLEWDRWWRSIAVARPGLADHRERIRPEPPDLDQPEDLYDLFDGLRPLPWLQHADSTEASAKGDRHAGPTDPATPSGPQRSLRRGAAATIWESRDEAGRLLQRVSWGPAPGTSPHRGAPIGVGGAAGAPSPPRLLVEQPPLSIRWRSGHLYELAGDAAGASMPRRTLRPDGELLHHAEGAEASFQIVPDERGGERIEGTIRSGGAIAATIRLDRFKRIGLDDAAALANHWRSAFTREDGSAATPVDWRDLDPTAEALHEGRDRIATALRFGDPDALAAAARHWSEATIALGIDGDTRLRAWESLAESLAAAAEARRVDLVLAGPWADELAAIEAPSRVRLAVDRIRQGRFGPALRLLDGVETGGAASDADAAMGVDAGLLRSRLIHLARCPADQRPRPVWIEPPGRAALDRHLAGGLGPTAVDGAMTTEPEASAAVDEAPSSVPAAARSQGVALGSGGADAPNLDGWFHAAFDASLDAANEAAIEPAIEPAIDTALDAAIEISPVLRQELRAALRGALLAHVRRLEGVSDDARADDGPALTDAARSPLVPADLAAWLASPQWRSQIDGLERTIDPRRSEAALRHFRKRLDAVLAAPPPPDPRRVLAEEALLLEAMLATADRIGRSLPQPTRDALVDLLRAHSDRRRNERLNPFFADAPAATAGDALRLHAEAQHRLARDPTLRMIADRLAMEQRLAEADPTTARFRAALIEANLELVADRIAAIVADALWQQTEALGLDRAQDLPTARSAIDGVGRSDPLPRPSPAPTTVPSTEPPDLAQIVSELLDAAASPARTPTPIAP